MGPPHPYNELSPATGYKLGGNPDVSSHLLGLAELPDPNERGWKDTFRMNPGEVTRVLVRVAPQDAEALAAAHVPPLAVGPNLNLFPFEPWTPQGSTDAFGYPGGPGYVWHCHIVDHEDNEMMRPMGVLAPAGPTATLIARFEAVLIDGAVQVRWQFSGAANFTTSVIERAPAQVGPWRAIDGTRAADGLATTLTDRSAVAGANYWYRLLATQPNGTQQTFGPIQMQGSVALATSIAAVSPNPARGPVGVDFSLATAGNLKLRVMDIQGREVATLASGAWPAGRYHAVWDGAGKQGRVPAGLYFVRYEAGGQEATRRVAITR
jgi:hypothetical protein